MLEKMEENDAQREILFFATPASIMKDYNDLFEELNLTPIVADVSSLSFYRLFYELTEAGEDQHFLFVEWDLSSLNLCIFHRDKPVFMRHISQKFTYDDWTMEHEGGITHLHCNNDEKVEKEINEQLQEVERVMNFYKYTFNKGEDEITNIILAGDHPKLQYIRNSLDEIDGTVKSLDEMDLGIHYHYILPLSLCLKEVVK
ncbi:MAG: hypothetical protein LRY73_03895 [Bacillus sp. (in: Bacteria)]|nr:hypothetical protein [Bacillus sp. (in: firmicutes)]